MNHEDLRRIAEQFKAEIIVRLREMNKKLIEANPNYSQTLAALLDAEEWAVNDAWKEVFGECDTSET